MGGFDIYSGIVMPKRPVIEARKPVPVMLPKADSLMVRDTLVIDKKVEVPRRKPEF
jgi:hypothetical protein